MKIIVLLIVIVSGCSSLPKTRTDKLSILQGLTNAKEVEFSILAPKKKTLRFELRSAEGEIIAPEEIKTVSRDFSEYSILKHF